MSPSSMFIVDVEAPVVIYTYDWSPFSSEALEQDVSTARGGETAVGRHGRRLFRGRSPDFPPISTDFLRFSVVLKVSLGSAWFLASPQQAAKRAELGHLYGRGQNSMVWPINLEINVYIYDICLFTYMKGKYK